MAPGYNVFVRMPQLDTKDLFQGGALEFPPQSGSAPLDAGTPVNNVPDRFAGGACDLSVLAMGKTMPHYEALWRKA
ncbi:MAG: hypothetical protein QOJ99_2229 [Bryobacterales bacterium]|nr:hypothetical protein [Bryobacterales bacterium]